MQKNTNSVLGFIRRNLIHCPSKLKELAYFALVRSKLEYGAAIWDPYTKHNIDKIEKIQRRASRFVTRTYEQKASVTELLDKLKWDTLEKRRKNQRLSLLYKIHNNTLTVPSENYLVFNNSTTRQGQKNNFRILRSNTEIHRQSYFPRTVKDWNALPQDVKECNTLTAFKERLRTA